MAIHDNYFIIDMVIQISITKIVIIIGFFKAESNLNTS